MPNVIVTNTNTSPISVLGLGPVQPNATKSGYIEEAQYAPHAVAYRERGVNVGLVVQEVGMDPPTGTQAATTTATLEEDVTIVLCDSSGGTFVLTLLSAADVADGVAITFLNVGSANQATLTCDGAEKIDPDNTNVATKALTFGTKVILVSNGVDGWTYG